MAGPVTARVVELAIFSFLLPLAVGGLWLAIRRDRTWIAGAAVLTAGCVFSIVVALRGHTLMGGGGYGVDHRRAVEHTSTGDVVLAVVSAAVGVLAVWVLATLARRRHG